MTLSKLSLRNAQRQAQDYLVYFVTIVISAALVHAFNGLVFSQELHTLSDMMQPLPFVIVLASMVVVCIIGWLVNYTTRFMLAKRSRELGTYILIGLENTQVARLFFLENLAVGAVAVVLGTLLGNLLFQALRAIMLSMFSLPYSFSFSFSLGAVLLTLFYFALIYLFALRRSHKLISTMKICELMNYDRQNEGEVITKSRTRRKTSASSIVLGVIGTLLLLLGNLTLGIVGAGCIIVFLYGFFVSFSSGIPAYYDKRPEKKFKGHQLLIFRSLSAKLATMGVVMATISLLFTATLISEGLGMLFSVLVQSNIEQTTSFDLFISSSVPSETHLDEYIDYTHANIPIDREYKYNIYRGESLQVTDYIGSNADYFSGFKYDTIMRASDYTALRAMLGYPAATQEQGQYLIHCMDYLGKLMKGYTQPITVGGSTLTPGGVYTEIFTQYVWDGNGRAFILVVPDEVAAALPVSHSIYAAMTTSPVPQEHFLELHRIRNLKDKQTDNYDTLFSQASIESEYASIYAIFVFPLYYLALVLTMVSATILTIQQLSETDRYRRQFALLHKLGMDRQEMKRTLRRQFAIFYAMPTLPSLLVSLPILLRFSHAFDPGVISGPWHRFVILATTLLLFFAIYLVYIVLAYTALKRSVIPEE